MKIDWTKIVSEYEIQNPPDFITHLNYVSFMQLVSKNMKLSCNLSIQNQIQESRNLAKKTNLLNLTMKSIKGEYNTIMENPDYAELCVSWISVKSYYIIYNLLLILEYLISGSESAFGFSHKKVINSFKNRLEENEISFNKKILNANFQCLKIFNQRAKPGSNIKIVGVDLRERSLQVLKKLVDYKLEDFKRENKIKNFRSKVNRQKRQRFLDNNTVNICEFFYWYRIKANYRDLEFLNKDISNYKFKEFYQNYFELTCIFFNSFKTLINELSKIRLKKKIL